MIEEVQNLFKRNMSDYEILQKTGVANVGRFKTMKKKGLDMILYINFINSN